MNELFEQTDIWQDYDPDDIVKNKIPIILDYIPEEVNSIADVGCGNGIITNILGQKYDITGIDSSEKALQHVHGKKQLNQIYDIKLEDNSFDLVLCSEVLEHIPPVRLHEAIKELVRISNKYLLITVPNEEFLDQTFVKCPDCGNIFHSYGHLNKFNKVDLIKHFEKYATEKRVSIEGPLRKQYNKLLLSLRHSIGKRYFNPPNGISFCDQCSCSSFPEIKGNLVSKICNFINLIVSKKSRYWLFVLFEKK